MLTAERDREREGDRESRAEIAHELYDYGL